ncbi:MarR family winged helix-turn-helix transcriptional regulator [Kutzneria albida]|uniref:HTH marR-type domain-containing protein n=1 Tax=Kutzneria albida DSM 43870 TaxID=1449976 RepID=W5W4H0_9PSEU|nr:hypothetical protein KALB_2286 [Kutzneria albida DSM 43870]
MTASADELMTVTTGLRRLVRRRLQAGLTGPRLRGAQVELLRVASARPGLGVAAAAAELHLARNSVSTLVNQLVDQDLLRRETDPDDRRNARLYVTEAAEQRLAAWRQARTELVGAALADLDPADRAAIGQALPALRRLITRLEADS